jgi:hypothetical protein
VIPFGAERVPSLPEDVTGATPAEATVAPAASNNASPVCRVGLLVDALVQERWVVEAVQTALDMPGMRLVTIAVAGYRRNESFASRLHHVLDGVDGQLRCRHEELLSRANLAVLFAGVPRTDVTFEATSGGWAPDENGLRVLRDAAADAWLYFCAEPPRRPLPDFARYGVLGLEIGVDVAAGCGWAGAPEVAAGSPVTIARIVDYRTRHGLAVYQGLGATIRNSACRNRLIALRRAIGFIRRSLMAATRNGPCAVHAELPPRYPAAPKPTVARVLRLGCRLVGEVVASRWRELGWQRQWQIGYAFGDGVRPDLQQLRYLVPPRDRFWADPFVIADGDRHFIFLEEYQYRTRRGRIVAIEVDERDAPGAPVSVLERPYHLSYPFLFRWRDALYMLPESAENGTVELYRCEELPSRWRLDRVLLTNVRAYDATLWRHADRWWMFVNIAPPGTDGNDELHLYSCATPLGPWTPHPGNPVVVDTRRARSAGPLFVLDGVLYRPSQDCSLAYGHSISINRVDVLDEHDYRETSIERIEPGWRRDILCVHTLGGSGRLRVVDVLVKRARWNTTGRDASA